ncbi:phosphate propanoyltransferase [Kluyvera intermedia]|jgi:putative phosphotransacetylase|uniref:Phosphate propanoyltransferase n=1 Tax=Kluyvera intermedia TaxID=61648 RepID=A0A447MIM5_KLUIN|nr:phosphate propanoyltransferase [Kluyvera intermedia]QGH30629.1 phosphate propanoyltransferase [Kluyvera intermedia]QGH39611.1 phosphate propanoyltransferase [Kluyvera intermedia]WEJ86010.1 MAG: phosphate propanoyltransferase [Kluyvera intermedia]WGL54806.1 phosphate propanoyltransferase [Kluyvera intermedia]WQD28237.1 phosphate propanoyltransferase [Kluyvera intermedia]
MIDTLLQEKITARLSEAAPAIPVGISNRHVHLAQQDVEALFGKGYTLTPLKPLRQPGQFAAEECVTIVGPKGSLKNVRVLGPTRPVTQLEVSRADCFTLGIKAPVRESGQLEKAGDALLVGPKGHVDLHSQVICAWRHIHLSPQDARRLNVINGQKVSVRSTGERQLTFDEVVVRVRDDFALEFHIDTEEANAAGLKNGAQVTLVR